MRRMRSSSRTRARYCGPAFAASSSRARGSLDARQALTHSPQLRLQHLAQGARALEVRDDRPGLLEKGRHGRTRIGADGRCASEAPAFAGPELDEAAYHLRRRHHPPMPGTHQSRAHETDRGGERHDGQQPGPGRGRATAAATRRDQRRLGAHDGDPVIVGGCPIEHGLIGLQSGYGLHDRVGFGFGDERLAHRGGYARHPAVRPAHPRWAQGSLTTRKKQSRAELADGSEAGRQDHLLVGHVLGAHGALPRIGDAPLKARPQPERRTVDAGRLCSGRPVLRQHQIEAPALDPRGPVCGAPDGFGDPHPGNAGAGTGDDKSVDGERTAAAHLRAAGRDLLLFALSDDGVTPLGGRRELDAAALEAAVVGHDERIARLGKTCRTDARS